MIKDNAGVMNQIMNLVPYPTTTAHHYCNFISSLPLTNNKQNINLKLAQQQW